MPRTALILIDVQKDFFDGRSGHIGNLRKAICLPGVRRLVSHARDRNWDVFHVVTIHEGTHTLPGHLQKLGVQPYCIDGTEGSEIVGGIFEPGDKRISKRWYSGFVGTNLHAEVEDAQSIIIAGVAADCCILTTAFDAATRHAKDVYLPYQATSASTCEAYVFGLQCVAKSAGAVVDLNELIRRGEPAWDQRIHDVNSLTATLRDWYESRSKTAQALEDEVKTRSVPVDEALKLLDSKLPADS